MRQCFTTWYQTHYIKDGAATSSGTKSNAELAESMKVCSRETALYNKCLKVRPGAPHSKKKKKKNGFFLNGHFVCAQAKLDALGLAHLNTNSLAKDDD
jgi:hypothetical protein